MAIHKTLCKTPWGKIVSEAPSKGKAATSAEMVLEGVIGWDWEKGWNASDQTTTKEFVRKELKALAGLKVKAVTVRINSVGGSVLHGLSIHDLLAASPAEVTTVVEGMTASAATIIAQAGDVRKMSDNALYLIHKPWNYAMGNVNEIQQTLDDLNAAEERMNAIYAKRGVDPDALAELMEANNGNGRWLSGAEALEAGLIDEVYEPRDVAALVPPSEAMAAMFCLPECPAGEQSTLEGKEGAGAPTSGKPKPKPEYQAMDKQQIGTLKALFGADIACQAMEDETEYADAMLAGAKGLVAKVTELKASVEAVTGERDTLTAEVAKIKAEAADPLAGSDEREEEEGEDEPKTIVEDHAALVAGGMSKAEAYAKLRAERPADYQAQIMEAGA